MKKEIRIVCYDEQLHLEAYCLQGIVQPFPSHFHDYYVIGIVENGVRHLNCKNKTYTISKGNIVIFNPHDNHGCVQSDEGTFAYRGLNISKETMLSLVHEITGQKILPEFCMNVIDNKDLYDELYSLHQTIMEGSKEFHKEEMLIFFISHLLEQYGYTLLQQASICRKEVALICQFIEEHYHEPITLKQLCQYCHLSQSTLLRAFTKYKGVTPYRYLQTIRISQAQKLLEQGYSPLEVSLKTGFSDQSHFSNCFCMFTGLSPGAYKRIFKEGKNNEKS